MVQIGKQDGATTLILNRPKQRNALDAGVIDGLIHFAAGRVGPFIQQDDLQIYDPRRDRWTFGASLIEPTSGHAVQVVAGRLYAIGGEQVRLENVLQLTQAYDPVADGWSLAAPPPIPIHAGSGFQPRFWFRFQFSFLFKDFL